MEQTLDGLTALLVRGRLHSPETARTLCERWRKDAGPSAEPLQFLRWLVAQGHLTDYQANLLGQGRAEGLFLGPYKILERIGEGRMAGAYRAVHEANAAPAVIKVLPPSKAKDPLALARFQREAKLALTLQHPSVVRALQAGEANGVHYLVMEHLDGGTLQELLVERGKLPVREAARIAFLTALGLQHIHDKGLIHGDLKPGNLMLCPRPKPGETTLRSLVKILDIGVGRNLLAPSNLDDSDHWVTADGVKLGTSDYLAPEQAKDARSADIRADLYSLGCLLYHLLAGLPPFPDKNPVRKIARHTKEPPRPLREVDASVPEGLERMVAKLLAKAPAERYATPLEAAEALKPFLAPETEPQQPRGTGDEPESLPSSEGPGKPPVDKGARHPAQKAEGEKGAADVVKPPPLPRKVPEGIPVELPGKRPGGPPRTRSTPAAVDEPRPSKTQGVPPSELDLEKIDVEAVSPIDLVMEFFHFRSRDVFMLVVGAVAGGGLVALVWLLVAWLGGQPSLE